MKKFLFDFFHDPFNWFLFGIMFGAILITISYSYRGYLVW